MYYVVTNNADMVQCFSNKKEGIKTVYLENKVINI